MHNHLFSMIRFRQFNKLMHIQAIREWNTDMADAADLRRKILNL